jgi:hypothetical protein
MIRALPLVAALFAALAATAAAPAAQAGCGTNGYAYAGLQSLHRGHGIRATLTARRAPNVRSGHVGAWVGVGGVGLGPNGADEWLQVGLSAFAEGPSRLYFEVTRPGASPRYAELASAVEPGRAVDVAVLEMSARPEWWRVWVDGKPATEPIHLPGSSGRWRPMAVAESWDGGRGVCNGFDYAFERVRVARARGGSWKPFASGYRWQDGAYRVVQQARASFLALGRV